MKSRRLSPNQASVRPRGVPPDATWLGHLAWGEIARATRLSARELQITQAVFDNLTDGDIASRLHLSEHTVHEHLNRLFRRLHIHTRAQLILCIVGEFMRLTLADDSPLPPV